jgi:hypothetical protein
MEEIIDVYIKASEVCKKKLSKHLKPAHYELKYTCPLQSAVYK